MYKLYQFFLQYRAFLFFLLLQVICWWMIFRYNNFQGSAFFSTSNYYAGELLETRSSITEYFSLKKVNLQLAKENAELRQQLTKERATNDLKNISEPDYLRINRFDFIPAKVIKNSVDQTKNYITLDKGSKDGVKVDMGVISPMGIIGKVKQTSKHFSTVISLLHTNISVASKIKNKNIRGSITWSGEDPTTANLEDILRHHNITSGDTIITSEDNSIFPEGVVIGIIEDYQLDEGSSTYNITVDLATDFTALAHVYVIENKMRPERDSLEQVTANEN